MDYNQPYGAAAGAPYVNGNPATGVRGSIPPAAALEQPQRELTNLISKSGLTPAGSDLQQAARAVQSGLLNFAINAGTANDLAVSLNQPILGYFAGLVVRVKCSGLNGGAATLNVDGRGAKQIVLPNGAALLGGELLDVAEFLYDGVSFVLMSVPASLASMRPALNAARTYYVNGASGSDSNNGLTAGTPFRTLQRAQSLIESFYLNGYSVTVYVADYNNYDRVVCGVFSGAGQVTYIGNPANPQNCVIQSSIPGPAIHVIGKGYTFDGFTVISPYSAAGTGSHGVYAGSPGSGAVLNAMRFGQCMNRHICSEVGGDILINGPIYHAGNCEAHLFAAQNGTVRTAIVNQPVWNLQGNYACSFSFAAAINGEVDVHYSAIVANGFTLSAARYAAIGNGVVNSYGGGASYLPGNSAGTYATGGQYL